MFASYNYVSIYLIGEMHSERKYTKTHELLHFGDEERVWLDLLSTKLGPQADVDHERN